MNTQPGLQTVHMCVCVGGGGALVCLAHVHGSVPGQRSSMGQEAWDRRWGLTLTDSSAVEESHKQVGCHKGLEEWKEHRPDLGLARVPETSRL